MRIGIVGAGPAGASLALFLAEAGARPVIFDPSHPREKPCGGGLSWNAQRIFPGIIDLVPDAVEVHTLDFISPRGDRATIRTNQALRVVSRKQMDMAVLERAVDRGAIWRRERVRDFSRRSSKWIVNGEHAFDFLVGADGISSLLRRRLSRPLVRADTMVSVGYRIPGGFDGRIVVGFQRDLVGYLWFFPGPKSASAGIGVMANHPPKQQMWSRLDRFLAAHLPEIDLSRAERYGGAAPSIKNAAFESSPFAGEGWALVGDAAGLCDPATGEGIHSAFASAGLLAQSLIAGRPEGYPDAVRETLLPGLSISSRALFKFYRSRFLDLAFFLIARSRTGKDLSARFIAGTSTFSETKRDSIRCLPRMLGEAAAGRRD